MPAGGYGAAVNFCFVTDDFCGRRKLSAKRDDVDAETSSTVLGVYFHKCCNEYIVGAVSNRLRSAEL